MMTKSNASDDGYYCVDGFIEEDDDDDDEGGGGDGDEKRQSKSIDSSIVSQKTCTQCQQKKQ